MESASAPPFFDPGRARRRRLVFFGTAIVLDLIAVLWLADLFRSSGLHRAHVPILAIFALLNGVLILGSLHALYGFVEILRGGGEEGRITRLVDGVTGPLALRYAIAMPVCSENSRHFCARIEAIYRSLEAEGHLDSFDFFVLSDTRDPDLWIREEVEWAALCRRVGGFGRIYYRHRRKNLNRKAGNIGDFVRAWGGGYEGMLVLDADSLMEGRDIVTMARVMEAYPRLGILQTPPRLVGGRSFFTRMQQFAMRLYGPLFVRGLNHWQLGGGSYWGHNALIRIKPFSDFCELPDLPGREPFGGKILSHDFVEAALMVSGGWEVWLAWDIGGTYEEAPPTLIDHLKRDRRWCQGNLQHLWLIFARKLPLVSRAHLFMGIMAYLGSPVWFLFLLLGTWLAWDRAGSGLSGLPFEGVVQRWFGITGTAQGLILVSLVLTLLFLPKVLAWCLAMRSQATRRSFGGGGRMAVSFLAENLASVLLAPVIMIEHCRIVWSILTGRGVGWDAQTRQADGTSWQEAARRHTFATLVGMLWAVVAFRIGGNFAAWMSPILIGMSFAIPLSALTSRSRLGGLPFSGRIFVTPEEVDPPLVLGLADRAGIGETPASNGVRSTEKGVVSAIVDPYVNGLHVSLQESGVLDARAKEAVELCLDRGLDPTGTETLVEVLHHGEAMIHFHRAVWIRYEDGIHPVWTTAVREFLDLEMARDREDRSVGPEMGTSRWPMDSADGKGRETRRTGDRGTMGV